MGGLMSITGLPGQGPVRVGVPIADLSAGLYAAIGILVALLQREQTGKGQWVRTSLLQAQIAMLDFQAARWLMDKEVPPQAGNNHPTSIPTGVFRTSDGHINIACSGDIMWGRLCQVLGAAELLDNPDYADGAARLINRDALNAAIEAYTVSRGSDELVESMNAAGVPCGPIYSIDEVFADPQVRHLGMSKRVQHKTLGTLDVVGNALIMGGAPEMTYRATPERGQHTSEVLAEFGYSAGEIEDLAESGVT
jgi:formyl-CoA transferase